METNNNPKSEQTIKSQERTVTPSNQYIVDPSLSVINWYGSKPAVKHNGKIKVKSGEIIFKGDKIVSGKFTADMTTLTVLDLSGNEKTDLENHLKGNIEGKEDHFFDVNQYPESEFKITSSEKRDNTYSIHGDLIIKGKTNAIKFIANIDFSKVSLRLSTYFI